MADDVLMVDQGTPTDKSGYEGYPSEIGIWDMIYVGYAPQLDWGR